MGILDKDRKHLWAKSGNRAIEQQTKSYINRQIK